jgi:hypothetical protein
VPTHQRATMESRQGAYMRSIIAALASLCELLGTAVDERLGAVLVFWSGLSFLPTTTFFSRAALTDVSKTREPILGHLPVSTSELQKAKSCMVTLRASIPAYLLPKAAKSRQLRHWILPKSPRLTG